MAAVKINLYELTELSIHYYNNNERIKIKRAYEISKKNFNCQSEYSLQINTLLST